MYNLIGHPGIHSVAYARAGLLGNPSTGFFGSAIAIPLRDFFAEVSIHESDHLEFLPDYYSSISEFYDEVKQFGCHGGIRLIKASFKKFIDYCVDMGFQFPQKNCRIIYSSSIPRQVGLSGSSAIIVACMKALKDFYGVNIEEGKLANLALEAETQELNISAGFMDRIVQVLDSTVYMNCSRKNVVKLGHGLYSKLDDSLLPPIFVAYNPNFSKSSETIHNSMKERFRNGDREVVSTMSKIAKLADQAKRMLEKGRPVSAMELGQLMSKNFDLRNKLYKIKENRPNEYKMVECGRNEGAFVKFAGSGGSVVGTYTSDIHFKKLKEVYKQIGCQIVQYLPNSNHP